MKIRIKLEYDGSNYSGWQLQVGQDSIQAQLEAVLQRIFLQPVRVHGSGRTDAGVHALGQVAAFELPRPFDPDELRRAMNAMLPPDIAIIEAATVSDDFDPRRDARRRVYEYHVLNQDRRSVFDHRYSWLVPAALDLDAMNAAAHQFIGEYDFASFRSLGSDETTTIRRVFLSEWKRDGNRFTYRVEATSFMRHMVRTMVATMVDAGRGRISPSQVTSLIEARNRQLAPASAPPCGLFLVEVCY
ncbi:MAG: tRNA pseudouridine(38-40) synthase TruA [Deltaproteobacteria bacterium]|nr:tRNA pseudouridine(38-40) synthase TruA [Deltaproteobacteria bacterium]